MKSQETNEKIEKLQLDIALKCFKSQIFEKRIFGLSNFSCFKFYLFLLKDYFNEVITTVKIDDNSNNIEESTSNYKKYIIIHIF